MFRCVRLPLCNFTPRNPRWLPIKYTSQVFFLHLFLLFFQSLSLSHDSILKCPASLQGVFGNGIPLTFVIFKLEGSQSNKLTYNLKIWLDPSLSWTINRDKLISKVNKRSVRNVLPTKTLVILSKTATHCKATQEKHQICYKKITHKVTVNTLMRQECFQFVEK